MQGLTAILVVLSVLVLETPLGSQPGAPGKDARQPTLADLATVWIGGGIAGEYARVELEADGRGLMTIQFLPDGKAEAFIITRTNISRYAVTFAVSPVDDATSDLYVRGTAVPTALELVFGGRSPKWQHRVRLLRQGDVDRRRKAVTERADRHFKR